MKIRNGFVSNSSSSSFVVIMKNGKEISKKDLLETFKVDEESPLYGFALDLADWIVRNTEEQNISEIHNNYIGTYGEVSEEQMMNEIVQNGVLDKEEVEKIKNKEYRFYSGSAASDSDDAIEQYLCYRGVDIDTDDIKIESEGY